jgi:hypothetical protein
MMKKEYHIAMEIAGPYAMFSRNDCCGNAERSYSIPTYSAVENIFGSIMSWREVRIIPTKVEICEAPQFHRMMFNDGIGVKNQNVQISNHILQKVRYKLFARLEGYHPDYNVRHAFQVRFNCRLKFKKKLKNPFIYLGRREFRAETFGHLNPETSAYLNFNQDFMGVFKRVHNGVVETYPKLSVRKGVLLFPD